MFNRKKVKYEFYESRGEHIFYNFHIINILYFIYYFHIKHICYENYVFHKKQFISPAASFLPTHRRE
jgi:hypothetical protein